MNSPSSPQGNSENGSGLPEIYCMGSSSAGNSYIFRFSQEGTVHSVLVECGFPYVELVKRCIAQGALLSECEACLVTHAHSDHARCAKAIDGKGIPVFASGGTLLAKEIRPTESNTLEEWEPKYILPTVEVLPFLVEHDAPEPMGFIIRDTVNRKNILFVNDCRTVKADLSSIPLDLVCIECNYSDQPLHIEYNNAIKDGNRMLINRYSRIYHQHMGLYGCRKLLSTLNLERCKGIFLMHLSDRNAREAEMRKKVKEDHPEIPVYVFQKNGGMR